MSLSSGRHQGLGKAYCSHCEFVPINSPESSSFARASDGMPCPLDQELVAAIREDNLSLFTKLLIRIRVTKGGLDSEFHLKVAYGAACREAIFGRTDFLQELRRYGGDQCLLKWVIHWAARHGNLSCLRLAHQKGLPWPSNTADIACAWGHADCLEFAIPHCAPVTEGAVGTAVHQGNLACVKVLVAAGQPCEPYLHQWLSPATPQILSCFQHMLDMGCRMHPGNIIMAARAGKLDYVRFLHKHGLPLWTRACRAAPLGRSRYGPSRFGVSSADQYCLNHNIFPTPTHEFHWNGAEGDYPREGAGRTGTFDILRWGYAHGAPVIPAIEDMIRAKRAATRAVLLSFHGAARLRRGEGTPAKRAAWANMHAIPPNLVGEIVVKAGLEIPETFSWSLPARRPVEAEEPRLYAFVDPSDVEQFTTWGYAV